MSQMATCCGVYIGIHVHVQTCMCALINTYRSKYVYLYKYRDVCVGM